MRCEKPWSASFGATKNTRTSASVTSRSEDAASAGSDIRYVRPTIERLLRDHVLEAGPAEEREQDVVEREEAEIAAGLRDDARAHAADHERDRKRQEEKGHEQVARARRDGRRADERADSADPEVGEHDARDGRRAEAVEEEGEHRQRDDLGGGEERKGRDRLREPDGATVAGREHEAVEHALLPLRHERAAEAEQRREDDRHPEQSTRREPRRAARQREMEDDERRDDEEQHCGQRVARAQLEQEVLACKRSHVGEIVHAASATRTVSNDSVRAGSWVETTSVRCPLSSRNWSSSSRAPSVSSAVYGSSRTSSVGSCSNTRQSASRWVMPREYVATRSWRASQRPKRSSSIPIRSRRSGTRYSRP